MIFYSTSKVIDKISELYLNFKKLFELDDIFDSFKSEAMLKRHVDLSIGFENVVATINIDSVKITRY